MIFLSFRPSDLLKRGAIIVACVSVGMCIPKHLTRNPTNSLKERFFILNRWISTSDIRERDIVRFSFEDAVSKKAAAVWNIKEVYLLKRVGCMQGQQLKVTERKEYYCNGYWLGRAKDTNLAGEPVKNFVWDGVIPNGKFFAIADHIDSYDSRYFGFVDLSRVEAKAYPLF